MHTLWSDLQYGARILLRKPGFALITVLTLALGIGANTAIFSVVNAVLLRPLPVEKPSELAGVYTADYSGTIFGTSSYLDYIDFRDRNQVFSGLAAYTQMPFSLGASGKNERVFGEMVTENYFRVLGVRPVLGSSLQLAGSPAAGSPPVANGL